MCALVKGRGIVKTMKKYENQLEENIGFRAALKSTEK